MKINITFTVNPALSEALEDTKYFLGYLVKSGKKMTKNAVLSIENALKEIKEDIKSIRERDPAAKSDIEVLLLYSGVHAIIAYRVSHKLYIKKHYFSARLISQIARRFTGIEIHPGATIGKKLFIDHGMGVVIGETAEIGDNCTLYQGVTLGGTGKDSGKRHPTLGNNVMIGAGAKILGPFNIGDNSKIAANAVVLNEIPEQSTAVGIPAKVVRKRGQKVIGDVDQVHIPDPVTQEFCCIEQRMKEYEEKIIQLCKAESAKKRAPQKTTGKTVKTAETAPLKSAEEPKEQ